MRIVVAPGQGSQSQGFLTNWLEEVEGFRELLTQYSNYVNLDLVQLGTQADEDAIRDTGVAQPLIVAASLASYRTLVANLEADAVAGHSVGEFAAAAISGVLSDQEALELVSIRAKAMAKAAAQTESSMAAVLGGEQDVVLERLRQLELEPANFNGAGQIVAAGLKSAILELISNPPEKARVIELKVAGAFHTSFMAPAVQELAAAAAKVTARDPQLALYSNQRGQLVEKGSEFIELLVSQVSSPVRWDLVMANFVDQNAEVVELAPAGALSGLFKRAVQDCRTVPLKSPADFEKVER